MTVRAALNSALDEELSADPKVLVMGEEVLRELHMRTYCRLFLLLIFAHTNMYLLQVGEYQGAYKVRQDKRNKCYSFVRFRHCC